MRPISEPEVERIKPADAVWLIAHFLLICAVMWVAILAFPIAKNIYLLRNEAGYRPTTFVAESVHYHADHGEDFGPSYWATGTIKFDGSKQRLSLEGVLARTPSSRSELEQWVKPGTEFDVMYNRDMTDAIVQGTSPRVLVVTGRDVFANLRWQVFNIAWKSLVPLILAAVFVWCSRRYTKSGSLITIRNRRQQ